MSFLFRQRAGSMDWSMISRIDLEELINRLPNVDDLQRSVDTVCFSEFSSSDVRGHSVDSVVHLVKLMQMIIEYLLHCQESQFKLIQKLQNGHESLTKTNMDLQKKSITQNEDIKIYRRQLNVLRKAVKESHAALKNPNLQGERDPIIISHNNQTVKKMDIPSSPTSPVDAMNNNINSKGIGNMEQLLPIVDSVLKHERETQESMRLLMEEQRGAFLDELSKLSEAMQTAFINNKQMVQESQQSSQQQIDSSVMSSSGPGERENDVSNIDISPDLMESFLNKAADVEEKKELEERERELQEKLTSLQEKEREIRLEEEKVRLQMEAYRIEMENKFIKKEEIMQIEMNKKLNTELEKTKSLNEKVRRLSVVSDKSKEVSTRTMCHVLKLWVQVRFRKAWERLKHNMYESRNSKLLLLLQQVEDRHEETKAIVRSKSQTILDKTRKHEEASLNYKKEIHEMMCQFENETARRIEAADKLRQMQEDQDRDVMRRRFDMANVMTSTTSLLPPRVDAATGTANTNTISIGTDNINSINSYNNNVVDPTGLEPVIKTFLAGQEMRDLRASNEDSLMMNAEDRISQTVQSQATRRISRDNLAEELQRRLSEH